MCGLLLGSRIWVFETPWTVAHQGSLSVGFPRQEYLEWNVNFRTILSLHTHTHTHTHTHNPISLLMLAICFFSLDLSILFIFSKKLFFLKNFYLCTYFWLGLHCYTQTFSSCGEQGHSLVAALRLLIVAYRLRCFTARGVFPDQGSNLYLLLWQVDSLLLSHQGRPSRKQFLGLHWWSSG